MVGKRLLNVHLIGQNSVKIVNYFRTLDLNRAKAQLRSSAQMGINRSGMEKD
jgi:hypothetical protein